MTKHPIPHEITLIAIMEENGKLLIVDIIETSNHFAPTFTRAWLKMPEIVEIRTCRPHATEWHIHKIKRN